jgi:hypothetical protein
MPAPAVGGAVASIGGSLLSAGSKRRAAAKASFSANQANDNAIGALLPAIREGTQMRVRGLDDAGRNVQAATDARVAGFDGAERAEMAGIERIRGLLNPYVSAGQQGLGGLLALMGLNGAAAQEAAIAGVKTGGQFGELARQQEEAILANASATGGLRGGNTQEALASSRTNLLQGLIDRQMTAFGGLATLGGTVAGNLSGFEEASTRALGGIATGRGEARAMGALTMADLARLRGETEAQGVLGVGQATSDYWQNQGAINSGKEIAQGQAQAQMFGGIAQGIGSVFGNMVPVGTPAQMQQFPGAYAQRPAFGGRFGNWGF